MGCAGASVERHSREHRDSLVVWPTPFRVASSRGVESARSPGTLRRQGGRAHAVVVGGSDSGPQLTLATLHRGLAAASRYARLACPYSRDKPATRLAAFASDVGGRREALCRMRDDLSSSLRCPHGHRNRTRSQPLGISLERAMPAYGSGSVFRGAPARPARLPVSGAGLRVEVRAFPAALAVVVEPAGCPPCGSCCAGVGVPGSGRP